MNRSHLDLKWSMPTFGYIRDILKTAQSLGIDTILLEFENKLYIDWLGRAMIYCDMILAHPEIIKDIRILQQAHKDLFGKTLLPISRDMEINLRFA